MRINRTIAAAAIAGILAVAFIGPANASSPAAKVLQDVENTGLSLAIDGLAPAAPKPTETLTLSGTVTYRERMALPSDARVTVSLADVSLADRPPMAGMRQDR